MIYVSTVATLLVTPTNMVSVTSDLDIFYTKLLTKESQSGKMRWNAICEDITSIYLNYFKGINNTLDHDTFLDILFNPKDKLEIITYLFTDTNHRDFFMNVAYIGVDDPKDWDKWISTFRY
jgi:hypothetical protein